MNYSDTVWRHFKRPFGVGEFAQNTPDIGFGQAGSVEQKALLRLQLRVKHRRITDARFKAYGCGSVIACGSWLCQWLAGKTCDEAAALSNAEMASALELAPLKIHCAVVAERALRAAVTDYLSKQRA